MKYTQEEVLFLKDTKAALLAMPEKRLSYGFYERTNASRNSGFTGCCVQAVLCAYRNCDYTMPSTFTDIVNAAYMNTGHINLLPAEQRRSVASIVAFEVNDAFMVGDNAPDAQAARYTYVLNWVKKELDELS